MAVIERRGPVQYRVRIRSRGQSLSQTFATREAAEIWARETEQQIRDGVYDAVVSADTITLSECVDRYLRDVTPTKRRARNREQIIAAHILTHAIAALPLGRVRGADVSAYRDDRLKSVSASTVNRELNFLGHVFTTAAKEWGYESVANPVALTRRPRPAPARDRRLRPGEWPILYRSLRQARNPWLRPLVRLLLETAARRGELLSVQWGDVDLGRRLMSIRQTKTGKPRTVPLSTRAVRTLRVWQKMSGAPKNSGPVFPVTPNAVKLSWERARERAGIPDLRMHDLRHEATSRLFERGLDVAQVASITGHETLSMLQRYTHLRASDLLEKLG